MLYWKYFSKALRAFAVFIAVAAVFDMYSVITGYLGINNLNILHIYTVVEYSFLAYFLHLVVEKKRVKDIILISIPIYGALALSYSIFISNLVGFNSAGRVAECVLLSAFALYWFYSLLDSDEHTSLKRYPYFWLNSGITLYFMGNVFMFMLYSLLNSPTDMDYWTVHSVLNIIANLFYFIGFICNHRKPL
ncbi:MAG: hypothetical protein V4538_17245 [Bacteroidota bacterium]